MQAVSIRQEGIELNPGVNSNPNILKWMFPSHLDWWSQSFETLCCAPVIELVKQLLFQSEVADNWKSIKYAYLKNTW